VTSEKEKSGWRNFIEGLIPLLIVLAAVVAARQLIVSDRDIGRSGNPPAPLLVETVTLQPTQYQTRVTGYGTVQAQRRITILPQVPGTVVEQNPRLVEGGWLGTGDVLFRIDPRDYDAALADARAALSNAALQLQLEEGRQVVAQREWDLLRSGQADPSAPSFDSKGGQAGLPAPSLQSKGGQAGRDLALRVPHIEHRRAALESARSRVAKAEADLERTTLVSPFDALVLSESVEVGKLVNASTPAAELVAVDRFRVQVTLPVDRLNQIRFPRADGEEGSAATIILDAGGGVISSRAGSVYRLLGDLDPNGRLARVHVAVNDPLGIDAPDHAVPLLIGSYVQVEIQGELLEDAYVIPREALRAESRLWIVDADGQLQWETVEIVERAEEHVVVRDGLAPGTRLITSALPLAIPGTPVQIVDEEGAGENVASREHGE
jgi:RND family efflux transporter MFP subunit